MGYAPSLLLTIGYFRLSWIAFRIVLFLLALLFCIAVFPYLEWRKFLSPRSIGATWRGGRQYIFGKRGQRRVHGWRLFYRLRSEVILRSPRPITGISHFPAARLWVDSEAFPRIKQLIRNARHTVLIQMFIWKDDRLGREMAELLVTVADRGVTVIVNKEAVGDVFELNQDFLGTRSSDDLVWKRFWNHPRIKIHYETHNDHAKVYIIDDRIFLLSGMNIADESHEEWHDYLVELSGHGFVEYYLTNVDRQAAPDEARLIMNTEHRKEIRPTVMDLLTAATTSIVLEQCYFSDPALIDLLVRRSHDGIRIVLIVPERTSVHYYANMQSVSILLKNGDRKKISVFLHPRIVHGKIILTDRERAFIGSANLMTSSLDEMGEVNVLLRGKSHPAIRKLRTILREDILVSIPLYHPPRFRWLWKWLTWLKL